MYPPFWYCYTGRERPPVGVTMMSASDWSKLEASLVWFPVGDVRGSHQMSSPTWKEPPDGAQSPYRFRELLHLRNYHRRGSRGGGGQGGFAPPPPHKKLLPQIVRRGSRGGGARGPWPPLTKSWIRLCIIML